MSVFVRGLFAAFMLGWTLLAAAQPLEVPPLSKRVTDLTATLTAQQAAMLENKLQSFEAQKGSQLAVLIVPSTGEETIDQYSIRVVEKWKLGRSRVDDGALLIVAKNDRALRIEVGYGLEGVLTDATAKRIISEIIVPRFKRGDFYGGIDAGVDSMIGVASGESLPPVKPRANGRPDDFSRLIPVVLMLTFVVGGALRSALGRMPAALLTGTGVGALSWVLFGGIGAPLMAALIAFLFILFGGGIGHGGGWHSGGRSGGGFGGFGGGGGSFGGGGASGKW
jgi:uncharacterized protein